ncbi:uncharacterized protein MELLADRAFT_34310 [Melampsora larici-populina 98AG31]|uniref:Adenylate kinase isoenzyme 6 homolog n=1 Tax=Melampsora larici-populina (strain 98AG31 / pathotype 3-4-7) TaxID=747676 RepID=F4RCB3_MELLP|nr:uncharacterized protein MELLADRAFT_34310 [Melampsora larici-populina 98AG31]EGG09863.1 hypothetical protein MELLADRAFT_34310 [Melampsora larici-populina 98AG31]
MNPETEEVESDSGTEEINSTPRNLPNILITGTPGTGKTTHCELLMTSNSSSNEPLGIRSINIGEFVKENECHQGWDDEWQSFIVDDDKLLDALEPHFTSTQGGIILDWHSSCLFPEDWFDLIIVLRTPHNKLWDRLERRGYHLNKIQENNLAEIMGECFNEAISNYNHQIVIELNSDLIDEIDENVNRILAWIHNWIKDHASDTVTT